MLDILLGLQFGDEGKGKIIDLLTPEYDYVARFQGGPNAGHTLYLDDNKYVLHQIPSGIFHKKQICVIGNGVILNPLILLNEINKLNHLDLNIENRLIISDKINLILPTHILLDKWNEEQREIETGQKIGSTLKGISPTYKDKYSRNGLRICDIFSFNFKDKVNKLVQIHKQLLPNEYLNNLDNEIEIFIESCNELKKYNIQPIEILLNNELKKGKSILAEGAQGSMLDIDFGTYPYVTSSSTTSGGACVGLGISPIWVNKVIGVFKAYTTRVGNGDFPTELLDEIGEKLVKSGNEFGSTTGRKRRCGWLDLVQLNYTCLINGVTDLIMTKIDVLNDFEEIKLCNKYDKNGIPDYLTFNGWNNNINNRMMYIKFIESELKINISKVSIGTGRNDFINNN